MPVLEINDLSVNFATRDGPVAAVDKLNLRLQAGKSLGVVGESGSGKSQAMLAVLGLLANNGRAQGKVTLQGDSILGLANKDLNKIRGVQIGMVFQDPMTSLNPYLKIATQMIEVLVQHKRVPTKHARKMCLHALERVHIQQPALRLTQYPHELSGGMRQRVAIAMALLCEPKVLIADEPTTALDVTVQAEILRLIQQIRDTSQTSLVLISHDLAVVAGVCDHVLVMQQGKVVEYGDVEQVFYHPKHPYTQALLASVPTLDMPSGQPLKVVGTPATRLSPVHAKPRPESVMLKVTDLRVHFPVQHGLFAKHAHAIRAVDGVSFEVNSGQTLGIVGESGSGKSTLARGILGLVPLTFGVVELDGQRLSGLDTAQRRRRCREIQIIFQDPLSALNPRMTIGQILSEPLLTHFRSLKRPEISERVATVMEQVGLSPDEINRYPHEYSGGQCQRIGIARALIMQPKVIICDEPVSALDVSIQAQVVNLLRDIQTAFGLTLIFIAHDISVVKNISQRMLVMYGGKVVEAGASEQICSKPEHAYTKALLAAVPVADPRIKASGF